MAPQVGDRVILSLKTSEILEGTIEYIDKNCLEMSNIFCRKMNSSPQGSQTFYKDEVEDIFKINGEESEAPTNGIANGIHTTETSSSDTDSPPQNGVQNIKMDRRYFEVLREMTFDSILINAYGEHMKHAADSLYNAESVAVASVCNNSNRSKPLSLLVMCDFQQIYIFDMTVLHKIDCLKRIFENKLITKIVFNGGSLYNTLMHNYKIKMNNIFDLQISDSMLTQVDQKRSLFECLNYHFSFPLGLLGASAEDDLDNLFRDRPLRKNMKTIAAELVVYLLPLRDHFMRIILKDHNQAVENAYKKLQNLFILHS